MGTGRWSQSLKTENFFNHYSLFFAVTFGMTSVTMFYYTNVMKGLFKDYEEVTTVTKFWDVSIEVLLMKPAEKASLAFL